MPEQVINLGRVVGTDGADGQAATINVGTVTPGVPGSNPQVVAGGTPQNRTLNFTLPRGEQGPKGDAGSGRPVPFDDVLIAASDSSHADTADLVIEVALDPALTAKFGAPTSITFNSALTSSSDGTFTANNHYITDFLVTWDNLTDAEAEEINTKAQYWYLYYHYREERIEYEEDPSNPGNWIPDRIEVDTYENSIGDSFVSRPLTKEGSSWVLRFDNFDTIWGWYYIDPALGFTRVVISGFASLDYTNEINQIVAEKRAAKSSAIVWFAGTVRLLIDESNPLRLSQNIRGVKQSATINDNDILQLRAVTGNVYPIETPVGLSVNVVGLRITNEGNIAGIFRTKQDVVYTFRNSSLMSLFSGTTPYLGTINIDNCAIGGTTYCKRVSQIINCSSTSFNFQWGDTVGNYSTQTVTFRDNFNTNVNIVSNTPNINVTLNLSESVGGTYTLNNSQDSSQGVLSARNCRDITVSVTRAYWRLENCYCPNVTYAAVESNALGVYALVNSVIGTLNITGGIVKAYNSYYCRTFSNTHPTGLHSLEGLHRIPDLNEYFTNIVFRNTRTMPDCTTTRIRVREGIVSQLLTPGISKVMIHGYTTGSPARARAYDIASVENTTTFTITPALTSAPPADRSVLIVNEFPKPEDVISTKMLALYGPDKVLRMFVDAQGAQLELT